MKKYQMIISIDEEKAFNKIQRPFMITTLRKLRMEEDFLNLIKKNLKKKNVQLISYIMVTNLELSCFKQRIG